MKKTLSRGDEFYNEDVFWVLFDYEVTRSQRYPEWMTLLHIEVTPNAGDHILSQEATSVFCAALNSHLRSADIPAGSKNSYYILLPTTDENGGRAVCERVLSVFRNRFNLKDGSSITFALNVGMASHTGGPTLTREGLLDYADKALKGSKAKGMNTFMVYTDLLV